MTLLAGAYASPGAPPIDTSAVAAIASFFTGLGYQTKFAQLDPSLALVFLYSPNDSEFDTPDIPVRTIGDTVYFGRPTLYDHGTDPSGRRLAPLETAAALISRHGPEGAGKLNGDFVLGTFRKNTRELRLYRDHVGVRTLYYSQAGQHLYFASMVQALLRAPEVSTELDVASLASYLLLCSPGQDRTYYQSIRALRPSSFLESNANSDLSIKRYWKPEPGRFAQGIARSGLMEAFTEQLVRGVIARVPKSGPVGILLSGGLDSSTVASIACTHFPQRTFSSKSNVLPMGYTGPETDERQYVDALCVRFPNLVPSFEDGSTTEALERGIDDPMLLRGPLADSFHPMYRKLYQELRGHVVLSGDGGDYCVSVHGDAFLFESLSRLQLPSALAEFARLRRQQALMPGAILRQHVLAPVIPLGLRRRLWELKRIDWTRNSALSKSAFDTFALKQWLQSCGWDDALRLRRTIGDQQRYNVEWLIENNELHNLPEHMPQAHVDVRFPLLDPRTIEAAIDMPSEFKVSASEDRLLIKVAARRHMPDLITRRTGKGHAAPAFFLRLRTCVPLLQESFAEFAKIEVWKRLVDPVRLQEGFADLARTEAEAATEAHGVDVMKKLCMPYELGQFLKAHAGLH